MKNKNIKLILNYVIGPLVFCILIFSIYQQMQNQLEKGISVNTITKALEGNGKRYFILVFFLMLVNWGIEARKWQICLTPITKISFLQAFKAIFSGATVAFFTPNRIGEYVGRMWYISKEHRVQSIPLTILGSIAQLTVTLSAGLLALGYWKWIKTDIHPISTTLLNSLLLLSVLLTVILIIFYAKTKWVFEKIISIRWLTKLKPYLQALMSVDKAILCRLLVWSSLRYCVFIAQYWLMMEVFGIKLSVDVVMAIMATVFFLLAVIPTFGDLMDMGVRLKAGIYMVQNVTGNVTGMLASSLTIWIVNLVLPALIGSLLLLTIRIFNERKNESN